MNSGGNTVDSKIVELSLNNSNFESNATKSLSTLEKLKTAFSFKGSEKGFDNLNSSIKNVNLSSLTQGVEKVQASFSALDVIAMTTLSRITNKAIDAGERFVKSVTIDQVTAGWSKYAEKTSAVQTIMAATAKDWDDKGKQMEYVNSQLERLNWFTDETSYNFLDMVNNIGKFTSNQVPLEQAVTSMEGISTWAAMSGANIGEAGRAMYNLSQAIAVGSVKLMDWKSIENANMATAQFKETAIQTAVELGTLKEKADGTFETLNGKAVSVKNFNQELSEGWFSSEVLLKTLDQYGGFAVELGNLMDKVTGDATTSKVLEYLEQYKEGTINFKKAAEDMGMTIPQVKEEFGNLSDEAFELGTTAFKAAQEAKTFSEAIDSVKDAASTGWMNTFELLFGGYLDAKDLWTTLANDLYEIFAEGGNTRNELIKEAFDTQSAIDASEWAEIEKKGLASPEYIKAIRRAAEEHGNVAHILESDEEWLRKSLDEGVITMAELDDAYNTVFSQGGAAVDQNMLAAAKDAAESNEEFQNLLETIKDYGAEDLEKVIFGDGQVNEGAAELESTLDQMLKTLGYSQEEGEAFKGVLKEMGYFGGQTATEFDKLSYSELRAMGYSEEQIKQIRKESLAAKSLKENLDGIREAHKTGGELWTDSLYQGMEALMTIFARAKKSFSEMFVTPTSGGIYDFINGIHEGVLSFKEWAETSDDLGNVLSGIFATAGLIATSIAGAALVKGLLAVLGVLTKIGTVAGGLLTAIKTLSLHAFFKGMLKGLNIDLLKVAGTIGSVITKITQWAIANNVLGKAFRHISALGQGVGSLMRTLFDRFTAIPVVKNNITRFSTAFQVLFSTMGDYFVEGQDHIDSFIDKVNEMGGVKPENFGKILSAFKEEVIDYFLNFPGFKSLENAFKFLWNDIKKGLKGVGIDFDGIESKIKGFGTKVKDAFGGAVSKNLIRFRSAFHLMSLKMTPFLKEGKQRLTDFVGRVKEMGGIKLSNLGTIFSDFKQNVIDYFTNFKGFDTLKAAFSDLWTDLKEGLKSMGVDVDGIEAKFKPFTDTVSSAFTKVKEFAGKGVTKVTEFGSKLKAAFGDTVNKNLIRFRSAFHLMSLKMTPFLKEGKQRIVDFAKRVKEMGGIKLSNLGTVFSDLKTNVIDFFTNFEGFDTLKTALSDLWTDLKGGLKTMGVDVDGIGEKFKPFTDKVTGAFDKVREFAGKGATKVSEWGGKVKEAFGGAVSKNVVRFRSAFHLMSLKMTPFLKEGKQRLTDFIGRVKEMGGVKLSNIGTIFSDLKTNVIDFFTNFDGFSTIKTAFSDLWTDLKGGLKTMGVDVDGIEAKFKPFTDTVSSGFETVKSKAEELWKSFTDLPIIQHFTQNFSDGFAQLQESIGPFIDGLGAKWDEFKAKVANLGDLDLSKIPDVFAAFGDTIGQYFADFKGFDGIKNAFTTFGTDFKGILKGWGIDLDGAWKKVSDFVSKTVDRFGKLKIPTNFDELIQFFRDLPGVIGGTISDLKIPEWLDKFLAVEDKPKEAKTNKFSEWLDKVKTVIKKIIAFGKFALPIAAAIIFVKKLLDFIGPIRNVINAIAAETKAKAFSTKATGWIKMAASIVLIAFAIEKLGSMDRNKLIQGGIAVAAIAAVLTGLTALMPLLGASGAAGGIGTGIFLALGAGITAIAFALSSIDWTGFGTGLENFVGSLEKINNLPQMDFTNLNGALDSLSKGADIALVNSVGSIFSELATGKSSLSLLAEDMPKVADAYVQVSEKLQEFKELPDLDWSGLETINNALESASYSALLNSIGTAILGTATDGDQPTAGEVTSSLSLLAQDIPKLFDSYIEVSEKLSEQGDKIKPFTAKMQQGIDDINNSVRQASLTGALTSIDSWITGLALGEKKTSIEHFGDDIGSLTTALTTWAENEETLESTLKPLTKETKQAIDDVNGAVRMSSSTGMLDSLDSWITSTALGEKKTSIEKFAEDITKLIEALTTWQEAADSLEQINIDDSGIKKLNAAVRMSSKTGAGDAWRDFKMEKWYGAPEGEDGNPLTSVEKFTKDVGELITAIGTWNDKQEELKNVKVDTQGIEDLADSITKASKVGFKTAMNDFKLEYEALSNNEETDGLAEGAEQTQGTMDKFIESVGKVCDALSTWNTKMAEIGPVDTTAATKIGDLKKAIDTIRDGGILGTIDNWVNGDNPDFETFKTRVGNLAEALNAFHEKLDEGVNADDMASLATTMETLSRIGQTIKYQDAAGNVVNWATKNDYENLGECIIALGEKLQELGNMTFNLDTLASLATSAALMTTAASTFATMDLDDGDINDPTKLDQFNQNLTNLVSLIEGLAGIDTSGVTKLTKAVDDISATDLDDAISKLNESAKQEGDSADMSSSGKAITDSVKSGIEKNSSQVTTAVKSMMDSASKAIGNAASGFGSQALQLVSALARGIENRGYMIKNAFSIIVNEASGSLGGLGGSLSSAGGDFVQGFANGISSNSFRAEAAARIMARKALNAAKAEMDSHSPSKETYKLGTYFEQGFSNAINDRNKNSERAGRTMAERALYGMQIGIMRLNAAIHEDLDTEPVIRPVLDLTEIQNGAGTIGTMLNTSPSLALAGNLNAINGNYNARSRVSQDDILSALTALQGSLNNTQSGDTYVINGIQYDDQTVVTDAVRSLVRAIKVGGRA